MSARRSGAADCRKIVRPFRNNLLNFIQSQIRFLEKLLCIAIPRIRDFRGLNKRGFDNQGNYSMGIKEQIVFPEIEYDKITEMRGLDICITTNSKSSAEGLALLTALKFPFRD